MTLPNHIVDREFQKFEEINGSEVAVRVTGSGFTGTFSPSGLTNGGLITEVTINDTTWTALPATPLSDRNALSIQNLSGIEMKVNYSTGVSGYVGMTIPTGSERYYDVKDTVILYGKLASGGSAVVTIEEIS